MEIYYNGIFLILIFPFCLCFNENSYKIPDPEIVVYNDGFTISIPDESGIEIFFFYGSVNRVTAFLEPDTIIMATKEKIGGKWILSNNNSAPQNGEFIHYWLYVKKDGCDYRKDTDFYYVKDIIPRSVGSILDTSIRNPEKASPFGSTFPYKFEMSASLITPSSVSPAKKPTEVILQEPVWGTVEDGSSTGPESQSNGIKKETIPELKIPLVVTRECETYSDYPLNKKLQLGLVFDTPLSENPTPCPETASEVHIQDSEGSTEPHFIIPNLVSHAHSEESVNPTNRRNGPPITSQPNVLRLITGSGTSTVKDVQSTEKDGMDRNTWTWSE